VGLDAVSGARDAAVPAITGPVIAATPDSQGGWYLGIQSAYLAQPNVRLAHIRADKTLDPDWHPVLAGSSLIVFAMAANSSTVYIGGQFTSVNGQPRVNLAAVDAVTGQATSWNPGSNDFVYGLVAQATTVFAGGGFRTIGGQARDGLAALDTTSGQATSWNPSVNGAVYTLALDDTAAYIGGDFTGVGGLPQASIAAIDLAPRRLYLPLMRRQ
jgi:hypothetical protein